MKKLITALCAMTLALCSTAHAEKLSLERIYQDPSLSGTAPRKLKLSPDGQRATYIQAREDDYNRFDLWQYNVETGKRSMLVDSESLVSGPENLSDEEKARRDILFNQTNDKVRKAREEAAKLAV